MKNTMKEKLFKSVLIITFSFTLVYWSLVFAKIFPVTEITPGYVNWFMSFPIADTFLAISALLSFIYLKKAKIKSAYFGTIAGSSMIFLGLYALLYGINTGLLFILTTDEIIEIMIKLYCLFGGAFVLRYSWNLLKNK